MFQYIYLFLHAEADCKIYLKNDCKPFYTNFNNNHAKKMSDQLLRVDFL